MVESLPIPEACKRLGTKSLSGRLLKTPPSEMDMYKEG